MELTETTIHTRDIYRNLMKCVVFKSAVKLVLLFLGYRIWCVQISYQYIIKNQAVWLKYISYTHIHMHVIKQHIPPPIYVSLLIAVRRHPEAVWNE